MRKYFYQLRSPVLCTTCTEYEHETEQTFDLHGRTLIDSVPPSLGGLEEPIPNPVGVKIW